MESSGSALVVGLAGHVDHGKTSLVRALTGTDTDRLEEERRRGLTIELGFAHMELDSGKTVSFVDVPGHERFVRTMASGVSGIDAAMLVVDARESVRAQTREHADILRMLRVPNVLAVISKSDLVGPEEIRSAERKVAALLGPALHATVACSAVTGDGLDRLRDALATLPAGERDPLIAAPFRMPIDRVFTMRGSGTVVTGTVWQGTARVGNSLVCLPAGGQVRVRGVQTRGARVDSVGPGHRAAINLTVNGDAPERGHDLAEPGRFCATRRLTVAFELLRSCDRPIRSGTRVLAMLGTRAEPASVKVIDRKSIEPGQCGLVQLIFAAPVVVTGGQALLVRTGSPETTIGGGVVRSVFAPGLGSRDTEWHERLRSLGDAPPRARLETAAWVLGERSWDGAIAHQEAGVWNEPTPGVRFSLGRIDSARLESLTTRVVARIESLSAGGAVERSRVVAAMRGRDEDDVLAAIDHLIAQQRLIDTPSGIALPENESRLSPEDRGAIDEIRRLYESYGAAPPPADDIAQELRVRLNEARRLVKLAKERDVLVHVSGAYFVTASVAERIHACVRELIEQRGSVTVGDVRAALGVTRKHAVPICEYLDRVRITRRIGNERVLHDSKAPAGGP
ncbi:MAG: selenocysteine-specific translation elongation factor [Phycisphaerales bacterium]